MSAVYAAFSAASQLPPPPKWVRLCGGTTAHAHDIEEPNSAVGHLERYFSLILGAMGHYKAAETGLQFNTSAVWSSAVIQTHKTWARFGRELSKDKSASGRRRPPSRP